VNLHVTIAAISVLRVLVMGWTGRFSCSYRVLYAVARQTKLVDAAESQ
jgi:hypothetical protein